jgi:hypothetical protein
MSKKKNGDSAGAPVSAGGEAARTAPAGSTAAIQAGGRRKTHLLTFVVTAIVMWVIGTFVYIYFYPHILYNAVEKAIVQKGLGATTSAGTSSGIPINTLFAMPDLASPTTLKSNLLAGTNHDTLFTIG